MSLSTEDHLRGRYRVLEELGKGGMGAVYRGHDENLGVEVAIKENLFTTAEAERQFKREAVLLASLRHPHLPRVTDHFVIEGQGQYLVMDFVPGEDAKTVLEKNGGPLPVKEVLHWAKQILDALSYLHTRPQPVIHRDIKPANIKITPDGDAILVDFGLAKLHDDSHNTTVGAQALTPGFAPPEQYGLGRTDARTDVYSLAATLYTLLTGQMPADSIERSMNQKRLVPIHQLAPRVSEVVSQTIAQGLAIQPKDRFTTAAEFSAALTMASRQAVFPVPPPMTSSDDDTPATMMVNNLDAQALAQGSQRFKSLSATKPAQTAAASAPTRKNEGGRRTLGWAWSVVGLVLVVGGVGAVASGLFPLGQFFSASAPTAASVAVPTALPSLVPTDTPQPTPTTLPPTATAEVALVPETSAPPTSVPTAGPTAIGGGLGQLAFVSERKGVPQIFLIDLTGLNITQLLKQSVDGTSRVTQLTDLPQGACQPTWSPDGSQLLFISPCSRKANDHQYPNASIYIMQADGSNINQFIKRVGGAFNPDWSKAGIAYTTNEVNGLRIYVAKSSGESGQMISGAQADDAQPSWDPDGSKLVYVNTSRSGAATLYFMKGDGTFVDESGKTIKQPQPITQGLIPSVPAWSPDGANIAFVVGFHIFVTDWRGASFQSRSKLTLDGPNDTPDWSRDGQWLTFESWRDDANHEIYIMDSSGGFQTRLTTDPAEDYHPAWRP